MTAQAPAPVRIRDLQMRDLPRVQAIYAHHVLNGLASFEEVAPDLADIRQRYEAILAQGYPYIAAESAAPGAPPNLVGYAHAGPYRTRPAYRYSIENSVYIAPENVGQGVGRALLTELIGRCTTLGYRQMVAIIGDSGNAASIGLHRSLGFTNAGNIRSVGFKFGRWVDSVIMQRPLGPGDGDIPAASLSGPSR
ncbi:MAG: GNAT family N-acetyltransferase [Alphaproteobacteria bacterium]